MKRFLLDTGAAQDFIFDRRGVRDRVIEEKRYGNRIGICTPVLGELWAGIEGSATRERNLKRTEHGLAQLVIWSYDECAAEEFGRIFTQMKKIGRVIQQIDIQVAAIAMTLGKCTVVSSDSDLSSVPGLTVENWAV